MTAAKKKEEEEAPPTFSEEELQAARDEAYRAGLQTGLEEAGASIEQQISATLDVVATTLTRIGERQVSMNEAIARDAIDLAIALVKKLMPDTAAVNGADEIGAFVRQALPHLLQEPRISVRVAASLAEMIDEQIRGIATRAGFEGTLTVVPDADLGPADCRILWNDGEAKRDLSEILAESDRLAANIPGVEADVSALSPNAPPLGSSAPLDVEIDLDESPGSDPDTQAREGAAGPA